MLIQISNPQQRILNYADIGQQQMSYMYAAKTEHQNSLLHWVLYSPEGASMAVILGCTEAGKREVYLDRLIPAGLYHLAPGKSFSGQSRAITN